MIFSACLTISLYLAKQRIPIPVFIDANFMWFTLWHFEAVVLGVVVVVVVVEVVAVVIVMIIIVLAAVVRDC
jgi:hypothetical protein